MLKHLFLRMLHPRVSFEWRDSSPESSSSLSQSNPASHRANSNEQRPTASTKVSRAASIPRLTKTGNLPMSQIIPGLFLGDLKASTDMAQLENNNIKSVLTLNNKRKSNWKKDAFVRIIIQGRHLRIPTSDNANQDVLIHIKAACDFIDQSMALGGVLVHCRSGVSRSAAIVIAYLIRRDRRSMEDVLADVKIKREIRPNENFKAQLKLWEEMGYEIWLDERNGVPKTQYEDMLRERRLVREPRKRSKS